MNKNFSLKNHSHRRLVLPFTLFSIFVFVFFTTFISSSILAPIDSGNAETVRVELGNGYYVETSSEDLNLSLSATPDGALAVAKGTVSTKTNCNGYKLYLSSAATNPTTPIMNPITGQVEDVATNSMILDGSDSTQGDWLPVTAGKFNSADGGPQAFKDSTNTNTNTWGFAVPSGSTGLPATAGAFDASYGTTEAGTADPTNKFASVPLYSSPVLIQETSTPNETGVDLDVYYGVYANMNKTEGDYTGSALYTVTAESPNVSASVAPTTITNFGGTSLTITTPLFTSMPLSTIDATVTVGGQSCPVTAISTVNGNNEPSTLAITCTAPSLYVGTYSVVASVPKFAQSWTLTNSLTYSLGGSSITSITPNTMEAGDASSIAGSNLTILTDISATGLSTSDLEIKLGNTVIPVTALNFNPLTLTIDATNSFAASALESLSAGTYTVYLTAKGQTISLTDAFTVEAAGCEGGANRICFVANEPSGTVEGEMEDQTIVYLNSSSTSLDSTALSSSTSELTLYSPNWTLAGYGFKGWNTKADGTGTIYGPNQTISTSDGTLTADMQTAIGSTGLMLYAQWVASEGEMSSFTASNCSAMSQGDVTARTYNGNTYAIAKLADNKCWMIENMRDTSFGTSTNSFSTSSYNTKQYNYTNLTGSTNSPTDNGTTNKWLSYGNYYSWAAAINTTTTNSTQYSNYNTATSAFTTTGVTQGICPTNWRIPSTHLGSSSAYGDFTTLNYQLNGSYSSVSTAAASNKWRTYPNNFVFAGVWDSSSSINRGTRGYYWSSTVDNSGGAYRLYFYSTSVGPQGSGYKYGGRSVRCVIGS